MYSDLEKMMGLHVLISSLYTPNDEGEDQLDFDKSRLGKVPSRGVRSRTG